MLPDVCLPPETPTPDRVYEDVRVARRACARPSPTLPPRERKVIALYYFRDVTMKQIGAEIGVNESRVSQLHARAIQRLQKALGAHGVATTSLAAFQAAKARQAARFAADQSEFETAARPHGVVVPYPTTSRTVRSRSDSRNGLGSQRQPVSSRKRSASVPATSPVTKITRRASAGELRGDGPVERRAVDPRHLQVAHDHVEGALGDLARAPPRRRPRATTR